jgi:hypothetical protein
MIAAIRQPLRALLALFCLQAAPALALDSEQIFERSDQAIFQVRVIHRETGKKSSIGSGFVFDRPERLATNYHVVASYIEKPEIYELRYHGADGREGALRLLAVDAVHDLALVEADTPLDTPLLIAGLPAKGAALYAMGNPLDLGLTIAAGNNGGELGQTDGSRILFSGSLNPGMSGGPTFDSQGRVVGVNVATARNDISFIVPARYLDNLTVETRSGEDLLDSVGPQIGRYQAEYLDRIVAADWPSTRLRQMQIPGAISETVRCWDASPKAKPEDLYRRFTISCKNENEVFLSDDLDVGKLVYEFIWLESDELEAQRFYRLYEGLNSSQFSSSAGEDDVTRFACDTYFIAVGGQDFKASLCHRGYKNYPQLSDVLFTAAMVGQRNRGFIFNIDLTGTDYTAAIRLISRLLREIRWQD